MLNAFSSICLAIILFLIFRKDITKEFKKFKDNFSNNMDIGLRYWFMGLASMMAFNAIINVAFNAGQAGNEQAVQSMIGSLPWMMLINAGILAPWNEELVFRKSLKDIFKNKWLFALAAGLLFGLAHLAVEFTAPGFNMARLLYVIPYGSLGLAFALMNRDNNTTFSSIIIHSLHNFATGLLILLSGV